MYSRKYENSRWDFLEKERKQMPEPLLACKQPLWNVLPDPIPAMPSSEGREFSLLSRTSSKGCPEQSSLQLRRSTVLSWALPACSHSSSLLFLLCFTLVKENCFDCIFLVDIKYLSEQGQSPSSYNSMHRDNSSGCVCFPCSRQERRETHVTGAALQTSQLSTSQAFKGRSRSCEPPYSHLHTCGKRCPK